MSSEFRSIEPRPLLQELTGLGLPFCKLAVERMGGRITLASQPGETLFAVILAAQVPAVP
jgi:signal transduction histidine kinase